MGYMRHHAIIVSSFMNERTQAAHAKAVELGMSVTNITPEVVNGYTSFLIGPDGSKEGWGASAEGDSQRAAMIEYLDAQRYDDDSSLLDWVVVQYGDDEMETRVVRDNDDHRRERYGMPNQLTDGAALDSFQPQQARKEMTITDKLIDVLAQPSPPPPGGFRDDLPEAFAALNVDGSVMVIGYQGEWYEPIRLTPRTRLRNWLVSRYNRQSERDDAVSELCNAIRLTVEYVGTQTLPPLAGWSWFDALAKYRPDLAQHFVDWHNRVVVPKVARENGYTAAEEASTVAPSLS